MRSCMINLSIYCVFGCKYTEINEIAKYITFYEGRFERLTHFYEGLLGLHIHFYEGIFVMLSGQEGLNVSLSLL